MTGSWPSVSIVMPAFNEGPVLEEAVEIMLQTLKELDADAEVIIVNDCSIDDTADRADRLSGTYVNVKVIHHHENTGIGGAFMTGVRSATKDYVMLIPVDNPLKPDDLKAYLARMGVCDIIVGVRAERVGYDPFSSFASFVYNRILVPLFFNIGISDVNWIQAYRRGIFREDCIVPKYTGIFFLVETLVKARQMNLVIVEIPATMSRRFHGTPSSAKIGTMWKTLWDLWSFFLKVQLHRK
jgi:glycosyltransferase involved in cell wall biosynthesis